MDKLLASLSGDGSPVLKYGGTETVLLYDLKHPLDEFCAAVVFDQPEWVERINEALFYPVVELAMQANVPIIMDSAVWRASKDYLDKLHPETTDNVAKWNKLAVDAQKKVFEKYKSNPSFHGILSAEVGPRGDGYQLAATMDADQAEAYHTEQIKVLAEQGVEMISAETMTHVGEALGIARAAARHNLPVLMQATVETNGMLPDGTSLGDFIQSVDAGCVKHGLATPLAFGVNCCYPTHVEAQITAARATNEPWLDRLRGIRANGSSKSHEELEKLTEVDNGDIGDFGRRVAKFHTDYGFVILGGCCGSDKRHLESVLRNLNMV